MAVNYCDLTKKLFDALGHVINDLDCGDCCGGRDEKEGILLPFGDHVISVKLESRPKEVYVSLADEGLPVCSGDLSTVGVTVQEDGFVLYAHIKTNQGLVKWIVR